MDNPYTRPFGTIHEMREELENDLQNFGKRSRILLALCHNTQAVRVGLVENVIALSESGHERGG